MSKRVEKVANSLKEVIAEYIQYDRYHTPSLMGVTLTITQVHISPDLKHAKIFFETLCQETNVQEIEALLKEESKYMRTYVAKKIRLRFTPTLNFYYDNRFREQEKIQKILDKSIF